MEKIIFLEIPENNISNIEDVIIDKEKRNYNISKYSDIILISFIYFLQKIVP